LDNPDNWLIREIAQRAYNQLLTEAKELTNKEDSDVCKIKLKNAWMLRTTLESILPDIQFDKNGTIKEAHGSLLQPRKASQGRKAQK
jgi:hypothetical protein